MADTSSKNPEKVAEKSVVRSSFESFARIKREYSQEQLNFIIKTVAPTLNQDEVILFIMRCESLGIDPMSGDITAYVQTSKKTGERKLTMIVARNWKRERGMANRHVKSVKVDAIYTKTETETTATLDADGKTITSSSTPKQIACHEWEGGKLWGAVCRIERDDYKTPFEVIVPLSEYKGWNVWESKPSTMIKKVAESQCWDMAVPELSRVYDESESFDKKPDAGQFEPATTEQIKTIQKLAESKGLVANIVGLSKSQATEEIKKLTK